jgi:mono/diheme cytochrome c family protein
MFSLATVVSSTETAVAAPADDATARALDASYVSEVLPLLKRYCHECHSSKVMEADVDLTTFTSLASVRKQAIVWQKAGAMLDSAQMPPKDATQPTDAERKTLQQWVQRFLTFEAQARAGDPGRVVLRRLSNSEYTYTLRDLTGIETLAPAHEFPVDGAAGEGFTNTGNALVMSPALITKYLDAAKDVARHAVLLPDGIRFSPSDTPRDWTNETLAKIRELYRKHTDSGGASRVNLQGVIFDTNDGGRLAVEKYLAATLAEREALTAGRTSIEAVAKQHQLNAKYLGILWKALYDPKPSLLLERLQSRWRATPPDQSESLAAELSLWQNGLWRFSSVGHIGKVGGPQGWQEPVTPLTARHELRLKIPEVAGQSEVTVYLAAGDAGDGNQGDLVVWERPRLVSPGRPDLLLRDVRDIHRRLMARRSQIFTATTRCLAAAAEAAASDTPTESAVLARQFDVEQEVLAAWLDYLGIGTGGLAAIDSHFTKKFSKGSGYDFINGWGPPETPIVTANSSDQHVRIPGNMKPHGVAMHPSPTLNVVAGWRSPVAGKFQVNARIQHAHPECGNGVVWTLEVRRGRTRQRLATGISHGAKVITAGPFENVSVKVGDLVSLVIGPRDGNHSCDLTAVDLTLTGGGKEWDLARDVSPDIHAGNPHADRFGNEGVWHFYTEPVTTEAGPVIPPDSLLAAWQSASGRDDKQRLAGQIQNLLVQGPRETPGPDNGPVTQAADRALHRQLTSLNGPLMGQFLRQWLTAAAEPGQPPAQDSATPPGTAPVGLDPGLFGKRVDGSVIDPASLGSAAPAVIEVLLPAELVAGCELVTAGRLDPEGGAEGSVQLALLTTKPDRELGLVPTSVAATTGKGPWTSNNQGVSFATPIIVNDGSAARKRIEAAMEDFRQLFPLALCYTKIVPVDEVVTLTLFHREDHQLSRLMLDDNEQRQLNRLWNELHYVSRDALTLVDAYLQLMEYATQDADPKVFEPLRKPIHDRAEAFRKALVDSQPAHLAAVLKLADTAYRRPLTDTETSELKSLYGRLCQEGLPHEEAIRLTLARVLVAPAFLYRVETPAVGTAQAPVTDLELASRLSYFLWASQPDDELRQVAAAGRLQQPEVLVAQTRRMLRDPRTRRLATEFGCQWLHIRDFDQLDEKSERHFPTFAALRGAMYEESILFFTDLFQNDRPVLGILDADYTFLNEDLARHYGIPGTTGPEWRRVDGVKQFDRGGILGQSTTLATQSGASRTSPILRGNWVSEVLLGERLPRPPKDVPVLPEDEAAIEGLTVRQLVEKHSSDPKCAVCHQRIDAFGFSLESFDAIGRLRDKDLAGRPIDTKVKAMDGAEFSGIDGLRQYLLTTRRDAFVRQFCRKLLGYSLGRGVQLSDELLLVEMQDQLKSNDYRVLSAIETIVKSRQFREIRGSLHVDDEME